MIQCMCVCIYGNWVKLLFAPNIDKERNPSAVLYFDNFAGHLTPKVTAALDKLKIKPIPLPPNCTPILQPLDHSLNKKLKDGIRNQWKTWIRDTGRHIKTAKKQKVKKPPADLVNKWVISAWDEVTKQNIVNSWEHCLTGKTALRQAKLFINEEEKKKEEEKRMQDAKKEEEKAKATVVV